ncbi:hypothetical protein Tco_0772893 [Tanacetum coccineum]|uniref:Uncharacterized protein n=1 Tax=Tanacetum coccineum TaxID=301880 RepID=A0ABQ4ZK77_9ASTR
MTVPATIEEKTCKKNDVKARSLLLMALPNEHQLTFDQYVDAQSMFAAIKARFGGNESKQEDTEGLLKKTAQKLFIWMNKPDFDTMGLDDLYNNFKIVEQKVKKSAVSTATTKVNTASTKICTASFSDAIITGRKIIIDGSNTAGYDKSKVECFNCHKKEWTFLLLNAEAPREYRTTENINQGSSTKTVKIEKSQDQGNQRNWKSCPNQQRKRIVSGNNYNKKDNDYYSKTPHPSAHKHKALTRECKAPRSKDNKNWNQGSSTKTVKIEDASEKAMCVIDGAGFDWSDMAEEKIQANMALMAFSDSEVKQEKEGVDFKIAKFDKSVKDLNEMLKSRITDKSKKGVGYNVVPSPHPLILNRPTTLDLSYSGLEEFKEPEVNEYGPRDSSLKPTTGCDKESDNSKENTDDSLEQHQMTDTETSSFESPLKVDKDWKEKFFYPANHVESVNKIEKPVRKNNDAPIIEDWVSDDEDEVETTVVVKKKTVIPTAAKIEKPVRKPVRYAEMYRSQRPRGNQRNWNGQKSNQLGCNFVFNNKACFICGSFDHIQYSCPNQQRKRIVSGNNYNKEDNDYYSRSSHPSAHNHIAPRAVLMKTGLKYFNTTRPVNTVRSVNTGRPFSTVRPFSKRTAFTKRCFNQRFNTSRPFRSTVNTVRARGLNVVKPSTCWVWRPIKPNGASLLNDKGFVDSGCSRHITGNINHLSDFKDFDGGYVTFGGGAYGGRITGKGIQGVSESSTSSQQDQDNQDCIIRPIWKDASYFGDAAPRSVVDAQIQDKDGLHDENDGLEKSHDDSSLKDNVNTATPEDLVGPSHASKDTQVEDQKVEFRNIPQFYVVPTTPHTRIHKDHPNEHVIGDVQSSVQTQRMKTSYSEQGFLSAIYEGKTHQDLHTCLFPCFLSQEEPKRVSKALSDPA